MTTDALTSTILPCTHSLFIIFSLLEWLANKGINDSEIQAAIVKIDKVMWKLWLPSQVTAMLSSVKAAILNLLPANQSLAEEVYKFLYNARYQPRYMREFTAIAKWEFYLLTGVLITSEVETNNPSERCIQLIIQCLQRRRCVRTRCLAFHFPLILLLLFVFQDRIDKHLLDKVVIYVSMYS